jgi:phytoene synthase
MRTLADFNDYAGATAGAVIALAARILAPGNQPGVGELAFHAGLGSAIAGLLRAFPVHAARGRLYVPVEVLERHGASLQDLAADQAMPLRAALAAMRSSARAHLAEAGRLAARVPAAMLPALLPVALARPLLDRMERRDYDPFVPVELPAWRRQWRLWRAAHRPSRIFA